MTAATDGDRDPSPDGEGTVAGREEEPAGTEAKQDRIRIWQMTIY